MHDSRQLEQMDGPAAVYCEHKLGNRITSSLGKDLCTGVIVWCTAPQVRKGKQLPILSLVERDDASPSFPDLVRPGRVLIPPS
jgi:hypothetical protein